MSNPLFDALFNASDFMEDTISILELGVDAQKEAFELAEKTQGKLLNQYMKLKTNTAKQQINKAINEGFLQLVKMENDLKQAEKDLAKVKSEKEKIL